MSAIVVVVVVVAVVAYPSRNWPSGGGGGGDKDCSSNWKRRRKRKRRWPWRDGDDATDGSNGDADGPDGSTSCCRSSAAMPIRANRRHSRSYHRRHYLNTKTNFSVYFFKIFPKVNIFSKTFIYLFQ